MGITSDEAGPPLRVSFSRVCADDAEAEDQADRVDEPRVEGLERGV